MSSNSSPVLTFEVGSSAWRWFPPVVLMLALLFMPWLADLDGRIRVLIWLFGMGVMGVALWLAGVGRSGGRLMEITWQHHRQWWLRFGVGAPVLVLLHPRSWVSPWLIYLCFYDGSGHSHQAMIWRFQMRAEAWRQWQLRLRLEAGKPVPTHEAAP